MPTKNATDSEPRRKPSESTSTRKEPATVTNHPSFFYDDRLIVIQTENVRFNVHKYQLMKSDIFNSLFVATEKAGTEGNPVEGSSIDNPIKLEGISASDFERLLTVLYASHFSAHHPEPEASLIVPAFRLANILKFPDLRAYLLPLTEKVLGDVDKIVLAREFDIKDWIAPAHLSLCQHSAPLTNDEATKLGIHSLLMISLLREEFPPSKPGSTATPSCSGPRCSGCRGYHASGSHCVGCSTRSNYPIPTTATQKIQDKLNEWVKNDYEFKD